MLQGPADSTQLPKTNDWSAIVVNAEGMEGFFMTHIVRPLLEAAADLPVLTPHRWVGWS